MSVGEHRGRRPSVDRIEWAWLTIGFVGAIDSLWAWHAGFRFDGLALATLLVGILIAIGLGYGYSERNPRFRDLGHYLALWLVFPVVLSIYSYLAATMRFPLCDAQLRMVDESMGFHWSQWATLIHSHRMAKTVLFLAYDSIFIQGFLSVAFFALTGNTQRNREMLWIAILAGTATVVISGFAPALGPMGAEHLPPWTAVLLKIRDGSMTATTLRDMKGIVAFPSFHMVLGVVFIYVHRPPSRTFLLVAALNAMMVLSTPFMGHHYLIDLIAGVAITGIAIIAYRLATAPAHEADGIGVAIQPSLAWRRAERQQ